MTQPKQTKAQRFVHDEVVAVAARLSDNFTQPVADTKAIARAVKRQMGTWGPRELIRVFWGSDIPIFYVENQTVSSNWGIEVRHVDDHGALTSPRRFIRSAAHGLLCQGVAYLLESRNLFRLPWQEVEDLQGNV